MTIKLFSLNSGRFSESVSRYQHFFADIKTYVDQTKNLGSLICHSILI
jgi:hypothetical protein